MEKFGYLVCDSCSPGEFLYIHPSLFLNIIDCVQNVVLRKDISDKRIVYFKILNNSEIVQYIHNDAQEECFGFCQLHRTDPNDKFKVFSPNKHLFVNLLDCVLEARDITSDEAASPHVRLMEWEERWEAPDHTQDVLPQNWGRTEQNRPVTSMVLKDKANDRHKNLTFSRD
ncbi:uncharacterized protein TNCV_920352 [Trichonephila clavipes]|nr:uncharacterized protein TNCV_920352 [Trichonephila clavipes]